MFGFDLVHVALVVISCVLMFRQPGGSPLSKVRKAVALLKKSDEEAGKQLFDDLVERFCEKATCERTEKIIKQARKKAAEITNLKPSELPSLDI